MIKDSSPVDTVKDGKNDGSKNNVLPATMSRHRASTESRRKLEEEVNALMVSIQQNESKLMTVNQEHEVHLGNMKGILKKKDDTMEERRRVDGQLQALNNEITTKRETLVRLQGNLQYKNQERINEAIRRLEYQLAANNYRVTEEIKIVQEINRLKRSKKGLCQYLASKDELDEMKRKMLTMRNNRDVLCRQVTVFRTNEEEIKRNLKENRSLTESLRKESDELHVKKRRTIAELKQVSQSVLHLKELLPKRTPSFKRKEENRSESTRISPQEGVRHFPRKCRGFCDPFAEHLSLCSTLVTYLQRLAVTSTPTTTPIVEQQSPLGGCATEIVEGDAVMFLHRREECPEFFVPKRGSKKGKKKKTHVNKTLSHGPEVFIQFGKLGLEPPATVGDVAASLESLSAKKESIERQRLEVFEQKQSPSEQVPTKPSLESFKNDNTSRTLSADRDDILVSDSVAEVEVSTVVEHLDVDLEDEIERSSSLANCSSVESQIAIESADCCLALVNGLSVPNIIVHLVEDKEEEEDDDFTLTKLTNGSNGDIEFVDVIHPQTPLAMITPLKSVSIAASGDFNVVHINGGNSADGQVHIDYGI